MTFVMTFMASPTQLGWQILPSLYILRLSVSPDDTSRKKAGLGYTLFRRDDELTCPQDFLTASFAREGKIR